MLPKTRKEAKLEGSKEYFTGKPCPHGHIAIRRTDNGSCTECYSITRKELYASGWRQPHNPETSKRKQQKWAGKNPTKNWVMMAVTRARKRAKTNNVPFNISTEYIISIFPDKCPIFGTEFSIVGNKKTLPTSPSLDRINCTKGYVVGNVEVISMKANVIKQNATSEDISKVANWLKTKGY